MSSISIDVSKLDPRFETRGTDLGVVFAAKAEKWVDAHAEEKHERHRDHQRLIKSSGPTIDGSVGKIGGDWKAETNATFLEDRNAIFDRLKAREGDKFAAMPREPITITLPNGDVKEGVAWETTPMDIAKGISGSLAKKSVVAKVQYTSRVGPASEIVDADAEDEEDVEALSEIAKRAVKKSAGELWDMTRPLEGNCTLSILKFEDEEGRTVFWHSSAHVLGEALEREWGVKLCIGPPTEEGFYYDAYMGSEKISEADYKRIEGAAQKVSKENQPFERVVLTKDEALELFADNPFKVQLITNKVPDDALTTAYRCGNLVDLCRGPHLPSTSRIGAFNVMRSSGAYWLGQTANDNLQRVYAVSFPDKKQMNKHLKAIEAAKERDHRKLGAQQELFFFDDLSPGSCFFMPRGAHIYNKLQDLIKAQYRAYGFREVVTPNMFNIDLWHTSGHAQHYLENMFTFKVEGVDFGLKPMNCPGHCLIFKHRPRSHKELPLRLADFGVLHRNEYSGALTGLTRVRRFQQDDAHIFCRRDQIEDEVRKCLEFVDKVYGIFGFTYELDLSTRPKKALGDKALWDEAEQMIADALDAFGHEWRVNPGDGAFYGPKIDIKVYDALGRRHQCATIQLDFQLPIRFGLRYLAGVGAPGADESGFIRPVIIHRAVLGSVERMFAVLTEHTGGKWPFWLSPRQVMMVPVDPREHLDYCLDVQKRLQAEGFICDVDESGNTLKKKIREAQLGQYNYIFVCGFKEVEEGSVNVRTRDNVVHGTKPLEEVIGDLKAAEAAYE